MTKLRQTIKWCNQRQTFRWKQFAEHFKYAQTHQTYLCYLVRAGYILKPKLGHYQMYRTIPGNLMHDDLYFEAYGKIRGLATSYDDSGGGIDFQVRLSSGNQYIVDEKLDRYESKSEMKRLKTLKGEEIK